MAWEKVTDAPAGSEEGAIAGHDGKLYVFDLDAVFSSYDIVSDTWTTLTPPPDTSVAEWVQLLTMSDGRLVMVGLGDNPPVQIYDVASDTWTAGATGPSASRYSQIASDGAVIYVAVADNTAPAYGDTAITGVLIYDPTADTWDTSTLPAPPDFAGQANAGLGWGSLHWIPATAGSHASLVYVNGWWDQDSPQGETYVLDLTNLPGEWTAVGSTEVPREDQAPGSSGTAGEMELALVIGGDSDALNQMVSCEAYDVLNDVWTSLPDLPVALDEPGVTTLEGYVYVYGGWGQVTDPNGPAPATGAQPAIYRLAYSELPNGGLLPQPSPDVPATTQLQVETAVLDTPGFLTVSVFNVPAGDLISFRLDVDNVTHEIDTAVADDSGNLVHHDVLVSSNLVNGSSHTLYANNATNGSDSGIFTVDNNQPAEDPMVAPAPPTLIVRLGVQRWYFQDPTGNSPDHYIFPRNPITYTTPFAEKVLSYDFTASPDGHPITMEGKQKPVPWTFSGTLLTKAEEAQFRYWFERPYRIYIVDHENRAYLVYISKFDVTPKYSVNHPERRTYQMTATVYQGPVQLS
jgi:hypothetical protein